MRQPPSIPDTSSLALEDIDHSRTKTKSPQTNGIVERFHKTVLDEFYRVVFRKKIYRSIAELQADLDFRSKVTMRTGRIKGDERSARRRCRPSLTRRRLRRRKSLQPDVT